MSISIDGFVAGPNGEVDWMFGRDAAARAWTVETISNASLHVMGSRTFRDMAGHWPTATDAFAPPMNQIPKAVFSRQGPAILPKVGAPFASARAGAESWATAYVAGGDLAAEIAGLKARDGKPIVAHGGASFARSLIAHGLVDQFALLTHPVVLGRGLAVFSNLAAPSRLKLVSSTTFPGGAVAKVYRAPGDTELM